MRSRNLFWGVILILLSALFALKAVNLIAYTDIWEYFWPLALIITGIWFIVGIFVSSKYSDDEQESVSVDLQNAKKASVKFGTGLGKLEITSGTPADKLLTGKRGVGMNITQRLKGDQLVVDIGAGPSFIPFLGPSGGAWNFQLNREIPLSLEVGAGISQIILDLSDLLVSHVKLEAGASDISLTASEREGHTIIDIEAGAAKLDVRIPAQTGARIHIKEGVSSLDIDNERFPKTENGYYQSENYEKAVSKVDITSQTGLGKLTVK